MSDRCPVCKSAPSNLDMVRCGQSTEWLCKIVIRSMPGLLKFDEGLKYRDEGSLKRESEQPSRCRRNVSRYLVFLQFSVAKNDPFANIAHVTVIESPLYVTVIESPLYEDSEPCRVGGRKQPCSVSGQQVE
jgi:hypothetical protein